MLATIAEAGVALAIAIGSAIYAVGGVNANNKRNEKAIEDMKQSMLKCQSDMKEIMVQNIQDVKEMLEDNKENARNSLITEIQHIKETWTLSINEIREDIRRLEMNQSETIRLREDLSLLKASVRSLHKRLDLEIPDGIRNHDHEEN